MNVVVAAILAIVVFFAALFALRTWNPSRSGQPQAGERQSEPASPQTTAGTDNERRPGHGIILVVAEQAGRFGQWLWNRALSFQGLLVRFNGILAVATLVLVLYNGALWQTSVKQAEASYRATRAVEDANKLAREALQVANRANINIENVKFKDFRIGGKFEVTYDLHNVGRSTATGIQTMAPAVLYGPSPSPGARGRFLQPLAEGGGVMGPDETWNQTSELGRVPKNTPQEVRDMMLTREKVEDAIRGKLSLQVMLVVSYFDGFNNPRMTYRLYTWRTFDGIGGFAQTQSIQE